MRLGSKQKKHLLELISEGLETDEINKRASKFKPPYEVSRSQVDHYRKTRGVKLDALKEESESDALKTGFARKEKRVELLDKLATVLANELLVEGPENRLWVDDVKSVGSGEFAERVDLEYFNGAEVQQLRGLLDDIAKEMGDRKTKLEHTGAGGKDLAPPTLSITIESPPSPQTRSGATEQSD